VGQDWQQPFSYRLDIVICESYYQLINIHVVYTLWRNAQIVPLLHTPNFVISKLQGGADLMTPGLAGGPPFPAKAKKGAVVAIASLESPSVPLVVGRCEIDVSALEKVQGAKGHAVQSITWFGDELWAWSSGGKAGGEAPEVLQDWLKSDQVDEITEKTDQLVVQDSGIAKELNLAGNGSQIQENRDKEITADGEAVESVENRIWTTKGTTVVTKSSNIC
jgi:translation initiation factor 2D